MIRQEAAGIYAWLPLGLRVLNKIAQIVREEQNRAGAIELLMPTIQSADLWRESGRYDAYGKEMLRIKDRHDREMLYGPTNEEMITEIFRAYVRSYKDLPLNLYHIQWKFRDEVRPRFGVMRGARVPDEGRLFVRPRPGRRAPLLQPDVRRLSAHLRPAGPEGDPDARPTPARSAATSATSSSSWPPRARARSIATAPSWTCRSRPPTSISRTRPTCRRSSTPGRRPMRPPTRCTTRPPSRPVPADRQVSARGIEVGHIFYFGTKYSEPMSAVVAGPDGQERPVHMGSYGIGRPAWWRPSSRRSHDEAGIIWPDAVAPFNVALVNLKAGDAARDARLRDALSRARRARRRRALRRPRRAAGAKFATIDLIGSPWQLIVGPQGPGRGQGRAEAPRDRRALARLGRGRRRAIDGLRRA